MYVRFPINLGSSLPMDPKSLCSYCRVFPAEDFLYFRGEPFGWFCRNCIDMRPWTHT